jgi:seryl-tRNA synthetase
MYALNKMISKGYSPMLVPTLVKEFSLFGSGYFKGLEYNSEIDEIYQVASCDKDATGKASKEKKFLVGTAEPSLLAYYSGEVLREEDLPMRLCGYSQCYRSEIGSYGKDTKGLYRVHEFMKVEQVVLSKADVEESDKLQQEMVAISKEMHEELGLPYHQLKICTGDMSAGKYKMFDIEAWMPSRNAYGETGSASNFLDWQARRLNVKYVDKNGEKKYVYMLNNTALPSPRIFIAILENYQQADGSVKIPEILKKYMPEGIEIIAKNDQQ